MTAGERDVFSVLSQAAAAAAVAGGAPTGSQRGSGSSGARKRRSSPPVAPRAVREVREGQGEDETRAREKWGGGVI